MKYLYFLVFYFFFSAIVAEPIPANSLNGFLSAKGYIAVPLHIIPKYDKLAVEVTFLNDKNEIFLLDNGAMKSTINPDLIKKFGFKVKQQCIPIMGAGGSCVEYKEVSIPVFQIDNFISHNETVYFPTCLMPEVCKLKFAGILGADFLREHHAILDIGNKRLYLQLKPAKKLSAEELGLQLRQQGYQQVKLKRADNLQVLKVQVENFPAQTFMLDAGSPYTLISKEFVEKNNLLGKLKGAGAGSTGGELKFYETGVKIIVVADIPWAPKAVYATDYHDISAGDLPVSGTLGMDWLQSEKAVLDMGNDVVYIKKN